jgi:hypothetical protein
MKVLVVTRMMKIHYDSLLAININHSSEFKNFTIVCETFGIYSLAFQKQIEKGGLYVSVI